MALILKLGLLSLVEADILRRGQENVIECKLNKIVPYIRYCLLLMGAGRKSTVPIYVQGSVATSFCVVRAIGGLTIASDMS